MEGQAAGQGTPLALDAKPGCIRMSVIPYSCQGIDTGQAGAEGRNETEGGGAGVYKLLG